MIIKFHSEFGEDIKTKEHQTWKNKHEEELKWAKENNCCPSCNSMLNEKDVLYDYGFKCGFTCDNCR